MRFKPLIVVGLLAGSLCGPAAASDNAPVIVVPGKAGVPVMINGRDASWAIVEGDWGLYRPGSVPVTVIYPRPWLVVPPIRYVHHRVYRHLPRRRVGVHRCVCAVRSAPKAVLKSVAKAVPRVTVPAQHTVYIPPAQRHYFPGGTTKPVLGRLEIEPKQPPKPAESYFREWSTESARIPADIGTQTPVIVAPVVNNREPRRFQRPARAPVRRAAPALVPAPVLAPGPAANAAPRPAPNAAPKLSPAPATTPALSPR